MSGFDPTNRELCPDEMCIGVIGTDGTCKECGSVAASATTHSRYRGMDLPETEAEPEPDDDRELCPDEMCVGLIGPNGRCKECGLAAAGSTPEPEEQPAPSADADPELSERELCSDDMCIGVIGSDGRCKECGTAANSGSS